MAWAGDCPKRELGPSCADFGGGSLTVGSCPGCARWAEARGQGRTATAWLTVTPQSQSCSLTDSREVPWRRQWAGKYFHVGKSSKYTLVVLRPCSWNTECEYKQSPQKAEYEVASHLPLRAAIALHGIRQTPGTACHTLVPPQEEGALTAKVLPTGHRQWLKRFVL